MICRFGDVVVVRFPFTDLNVAKARPAVVLSAEQFNTSNGQTILAMITTGAGSEWPTDVPVTDLRAAGLSHRSVVRWKLFSLVNELVDQRIGTLSDEDRGNVASVSKSVFAF